MRVVQVVNVPWHNATAWYGLTLARCLRDAGHEALVLGLPGSGPLREAAKLGLPHQGLPLNSLNPVTLAGLMRRMDSLLREFKPDVVNCHRGEAFCLWPLFKRKHGFALIRTRGDQRPPKDNRINRWLHARAADAVIATNSALTRQVREVLRVPEASVHTILGGVDTARFRPDPGARARIRAQYGFGEEDVVVGLLGRLDEVKGVAESIRALSLAVSRDEAQPLRLLLIAFASQYAVEDVARWAAEAGLTFRGPDGTSFPAESPHAPAPHGDAAARIVLSGRVDRPQDYINALDLGLAPSLGSEAIARAALEIMACGVPLIGSRVGVMPDLLEERSLFPPGDSAALAALLEQARRPAWRRELREVCRARIARDLSLTHFLRQSLAVYTDALRHGSGHA